MHCYYFGFIGVKYVIDVNFICLFFSFLNVATRKLKIQCVGHMVFLLTSAVLHSHYYPFWITTSQQDWKYLVTPIIMCPNFKNRIMSLILKDVFESLLIFHMDSTLKSRLRKKDTFQLYILITCETNNSKNLIVKNKLTKIGKQNTHKGFTKTNAVLLIGFKLNASFVSFQLIYMEDGRVSFHTEG